jgi:hypothetical protein
MQGAESGLVVSVAPDPSWLPHAKSGEASTFLWSNTFWRCVEQYLENGAVSVRLDHILN